MSNSTSAEVDASDIIISFDDTGKGILGVSPLVCIIVSIVLYKAYRKRYNGDDTDDFTTKTEIIHSIISSMVFGTAIFHIFPVVTQSQYDLYALPIIAGYIPWIWIVYLWQTNKRNPLHISGVIQSEAIEEFTTEAGEFSDYTEMDTKDISKFVPRSKEAVIGKRFRTMVTWVVFIAFMIQAGFDVLFMLHNPDKYPNWQVLLIFYLDKLMEAFVIFSIIIHARVKKRTYILLTFVYFLIILLSCIPGFLPDDTIVSKQSILMAVEHPVLRIVVGLSGGSLLWVSQLYIFSEPDAKPKPCLGATKCIFFLCGIMLSWVTGYYQ